MYLKVMVNGISRSQSMNDLRCLQRPKKVRLLPDEIMCLEVNFVPIANNPITKIHLNFSLKEVFL